MTFRRSALAPLPVVLLLAAGCAPPLGRVLVTVAFENETQTQCIKASARSASGGASINSSPASLPREGKDTLRIGLGETADLVGELQVTISRFSTAECSGTAFDTETRPITVARGAPTAMLEFRFVGMTTVMDAGMDAGVDAGPGCDVNACGNAPADCEGSPAIGCNGDGGCRYPFRPAQSACGDGGVCNSMGACLADVCSVLPAGSACDDQLPCTPSSSCVSSACQGTCPAPPQCKRLVQPFECDAVTPTTCRLRNSDDGEMCGVLGSECFDGGCTPWLSFVPTNFSSTLANTPYPTGPWNLASPDGGRCDTVISTTGSAATEVLGECGSPALTSTVNDAGVMVITSTGLDVGPNARLHFVGDKPVQLLVIGSASISGLVSVAPLVAGQLPAGSDPALCNDASAGLGNRQGGGGGGFGGSGGAGGEGGASGGAPSPSLTPLRGGCPGGAGFRVDGGISVPGLGGGALHLIVADNLTFDGGVISASGGGGEGGVRDNEGGGGGGSGGTVIVEARIISLANGAVTANGGGGGEGGDNNGAAGAPGALGPLDSATAAPAANGAGGGGTGGVGGVKNTPNGGNGGGSGGARGGGGGGGSAGVVYVNAPGGGSCTLGNGVISGVQVTPIICN